MTDFYHPWELLRAHDSTPSVLAPSLCLAGAPSGVCQVPETRMTLTMMSLCLLAQ